MHRLEERKALVTGGGSGIGRAVVRAFAAEGADIAIVDMHVEGSEAVAAGVRSHGREAVVLKCDVSSEDDVKRMVAQALAAFGHMLERGYGKIINTSSQLAHKPSGSNAAYCASKAAVVALTVSAAIELAKSGITVNSVAPGPTETPMWYHGLDPEWQAWKIESLPIGRLGQPEEIAPAFVFLASDESRFCIGQTISPNGGDIFW